MVPVKIGDTDPSIIAPYFLREVSELLPVGRLWGGCREPPPVPGRVEVCVPEESEKLPNVTQKTT